MYKYVHNNKYQMKYREFAKHSEARKEVKDNIYAKWSKAGIFFGKIILNYILGSPNLGVKGEFLVDTKFFPVLCHFSMIFIKFFKIPWYFQVFQVYSHFSRFSRSSGNPELSFMDLARLSEKQCHLFTVRGFFLSHYSRLWFIHWKRNSIMAIFSLCQVWALVSCSINVICYCINRVVNQVMWIDIIFTTQKPNPTELKLSCQR